MPPGATAAPGKIRDPSCPTDRPVRRFTLPRDGPWLVALPLAASHEVRSRKRKSNQPPHHHEVCMVAQTCHRCSRANPVDAVYCFFDGVVLDQGTREGPVNIGA